MSKEPLKVDEQRVSEMIALAGKIARILLHGTKHVPSEIERAGMMAGALVGAAQEIDGTEFKRPGVTSMVLDVLARGHGRFMGRLAQALRGRAGDSGDNGDKQGTDETVSPSVPVENAQELPSPAPAQSEGDNQEPSYVIIPSNWPTYERPEGGRLTDVNDVDEAAKPPPPSLAQQVLDLINPLHGSLDAQTYDEKMRDNHRGLSRPADYAFDVMVTDKQEADLTKAVLLLEAAVRQ